MSRRDYLRFAQLLGLILTFAAAVNAQTVVYDWSSDSKVPESYPQIRRKQKVLFRITNVNKILFTYRMEITQTPIPGDDFKNLAALFNPLLKPPPKADTKAAMTCDQGGAHLEAAVNDLIAEISEDPKLPVGYAKVTPHVSVPLAQTRQAWDTHWAKISPLLDSIADYLRQCTSPPAHIENLLRKFAHDVTEMDRTVRREQVFEQSHDISPGNDVSVTVFELYGSETTKSKTFSFPGIDVLTLSAGALFSTIPDRTYEARKSPLSELNVLTVEGNSRATPAVAALLNYSLGGLKLDWDNVGLALSAGPVLKLGAKSDASNFGFFTGLSTHLYHRFYITPGIHFGQFADFPVGFANESTVPANFGQLTPVKRWTARFGLAITFKTKDFSGLTGSDTPKVTGSEASGSGGGGGGGQSSISAPSDRNSNIARDFLRTPAPPRPTEVPVEVSEPRREPVAEFAQPRPRYDSFKTRETAPGPSPYLVSSSATSSLTHVTSISNSKAGAGSERLLLAAAGPIRDYAVQFKNGRFFLSLPRTRLDIMEEGLNGEMYTDAVFEQRGDVLVVSFALMPSTKARVEEHANGLVVTFLSGPKD